MLPFDPFELLEQRLHESQRPPDGKLHASSDLTGSLRHIQLKAAGAPTIPRDLVSDLNLAIGTQVHSLMERVFRGMPVMCEVKLDQWMPEGWSGTADYIVWDDSRRCFILGDTKTIKPGGISWIRKDGAKESHIWQISAYYHALVKMGLPVLKGAFIMYLPKGQLTAREGKPVTPEMVWIDPLPFEDVALRMIERKRVVDEYLADVRGQIPSAANPHLNPAGLDFLKSDHLAPVQDRVQKLMPAKKDQPDQRDVLLVPSWSVAYCEFPNELCDCRTQSSNKIGHYLDGEYVPRKGYEDIEPTV